MRVGESQWDLSLSLDGTSRLPKLLERGSFEQVANFITSQVQVLCCHRSEISGTDFRRPVYTAQVDRSLFDLFFNSSFGYRAAYFRSPGVGLDANVYLMRAIAPRLIEDSTSANSGLRTDLLRESLATPSAKAWLAEHGKEIDRKCPGCKGEWSVGSSGPADLAEIRTGRWESAHDQRAEWGRKAPYLSKLRFMGAFVDPRHGEFVPHDKRFRARDIHDYGWS